MNHCIAQILLEIGKRKEWISVYLSGCARSDFKRSKWNVFNCTYSKITQHSFQCTKILPTGYTAPKCKQAAKTKYSLDYLLCRNGNALARFQQG